MQEALAVQGDCSDLLSVRQRQASHSNYLRISTLQKSEDMQSLTSDVYGELLGV